MIHTTAQKTQIIVSTQSPALIDYFEPEHIVVVNRKKGESIFERLDAEDLASWLEDYSLGDLWRKGIFCGAYHHV